MNFRVLILAAASLLLVVGLNAFMASPARPLQDRPILTQSWSDCRYPPCD